MASSEAHIRAVEKYRKEKVQEIKIQIFPTSGFTKEQVKHVAEMNGMSLNQWLTELIKANL